MANLCPSISKLTQLKDVDEDLACRIRRVWTATTMTDAMREAGVHAARDVQRNVIDSSHHSPAFRRIKRELITKMADYVDIELLGEHRRDGQLVYHCNAGDIYADTIMFKGRRMFVGCTADFLESNRLANKQVAY